MLPRADLETRCVSSANVCVDAIHQTYPLVILSLKFAARASVLEHLQLIAIFVIIFESTQLKFQPC